MNKPKFSLIFLGILVTIVSIKPFAVSITDITRTNNIFEIKFNSEYAGVFKFEESNDLTKWRSIAPTLIIKDNNNYTASVESTNNYSFFRVSLVTPLPL